MKNVKKSITVRKSNNIFIIILILSMLACAAGAYYYFNIYSKKYNPPPMETTAVEGVPEIDDVNKRGYAPFGISPDFRLKVCGEPEIDGDNINLYLTSIETNKVLMKCILVSEDESETVLAESGTIKPGTYLKSIKLKENLESGIQGAILKVQAFEPETYFSKGTANLKIVLNKS